MNRYQRTREDHSNELNEDYVELIDDLIRQSGAARIKDIADGLHVSDVTVSKRMKKLVAEGLVVAEKYRQIELTDLGRQMAEQSRQRHELVLQFLLAIGVSRETAEIDAEGIEHHCSQETLEAMMRFAERQTAQSIKHRR